MAVLFGNLNAESVLILNVTAAATTVLSGTCVHCYDTCFCNNNSSVDGSRAMTVASASATTALVLTALTTELLNLLSYDIVSAAAAVYVSPLTTAATPSITVLCIPSYCMVCLLAALVLESKTRCM